MLLEQIGDWLLRRRVKRELLKNSADEILRTIERRVTDHQAKIDELKSSSVGFGSAGLGLLDQLYREIRRLQRYRAVVEQVAGRSPAGRSP